MVSVIVETIRKLLRARKLINRKVLRVPEQNKVHILRGRERQVELQDQT